MYLAIFVILLKVTKTDHNFNRLDLTLGVSSEGNAGAKTDVLSNIGDPVALLVSYDS